MFFLLGGKAVYASSASVAFSTSATNIKKGDTFSVKVTAESSAITSGFDSYLSYDPNVLEFIKGSKYVSGGNGLLHIQDIGNGNKEIREYTLTFRAVGLGTCEISVSDKAYVYEAGTEEEMSVSKNILSILVSEANTWSNNAKLASIAVSEGELEPKFSAKVVEYKLNVASKTTMLFVDAKPKNGNATVAILGNNNLVTGENIIKIKVTAPSKESKEYILRVKKYSKEEEAYLSEEIEAEGENKEEKPEEVKGLSVYTEKGSTFLSGAFQYEIMELEDTQLIPTGYVKNSLVLGGIKVNAYTLEKDSENDFVLLYARNQEGEANFYQYDRVEKTMQRYEETLIKSTGSTQNVTTVTEDAYQGKLERLMIIIVILGAVAALFLLGMIKLYLSKKGEIEDEF